MARNVSKSICLAGLLLAGCSSTITDYQHETPELHLDKFFSGHLVAYGMVQDFRGVSGRKSMPPGRMEKVFWTNSFSSMMVNSKPAAGDSPKLAINIRVRLAMWWVRHRALPRAMR